jgi:phosphoserine phosphatase
VWLKGFGLLFVLTVVAANPLNQPQHLLDAVLTCLAPVAPPQWLLPGKAVDFLLASRPDTATMAQLRTVLNPWQADALVSEQTHRQKALLLADMDSTMVVGETLDDLAAQVGLGQQVAMITAQAMNGELDFVQALDARVSLLAGLDTQVIDTVVSHTRLMPGAQTLVHTMKAHGAFCILISGGFTRFTAVVAAQCGFDHHVANTLLEADNRLTGQVAHPIVDKHTKLTVLQDTLTAKGLKTAQALTVGDGANDMPMLAAAGLGVGYHPKPVVLQATDNVIVHGDLTALLYAQGYTPDQWVN